MKDATGTWWLGKGYLTMQVNNDLSIALLTLKTAIAQDINRWLSERHPQPEIMIVFNDQNVPDCIHFSFLFIDRHNQKMGYGWSVRTEHIKEAYRLGQLLQLQQNLLYQIIDNLEMIIPMQPF